MRSKSKLVAATVAAVGSLGLTIGATAIAQVGAGQTGQFFNNAVNEAFNDYSTGHFDVYCAGDVQSGLSSLLGGFDQASNVMLNYGDNACTSDGGLGVPPAS